MAISGNTFLMVTCDVHIKMDLKDKGPVLRASFDVLDLVKDIEELLPDFYQGQKTELLNRADCLRELIGRNIKFIQKK